MYDKNLQFFQAFVVHKAKLLLIEVEIYPCQTENSGNGGNIDRILLFGLQESLCVINFYLPQIAVTKFLQQNFF